MLLVNVSGDVKESAKIETFTVARNKKTGSFFEYGPLTFTERLNNTGNVHFKPTGEVILKNIFGSQVTSLKLNSEKGNVLPASVRKFQQEYKKTKLFGRYTATMTVVYGSTNQKLTKSLSFWVIPYKLLIVVLLALIILIILIRFILKTYKRRLVKDIHQHDDGGGVTTERQAAPKDQTTPIVPTDDPNKES
jgi:hypothetical protein